MIRLNYGKAYTCQTAAPIELEYCVGYKCRDILFCSRRWWRKSDVCLSLSRGKFLHLLQRYIIAMNTNWFQQDDSTFSPSFLYLCFLAVFTERILWNRYPVPLVEGLSWLSILPFHYFHCSLLGYLKGRLRQRILNTI